MFGFIIKIARRFLARRVSSYKAVIEVDKGKGAVYAESSRYVNNSQFRIEYDSSLGNSNGTFGRSIFLKRFGDSDYFQVGSLPINKKLVWHLYNVQ